MDPEIIKCIYSDFLYRNGVVHYIDPAFRWAFAWAYEIDGFKRDWMMAK